MVAESWFRNLWRTSKKHDFGPQEALIGVLAFEVASLMSKVVYLWQSLSDKQVVNLREEIMNSLGIRKLVSNDDEYIVKLICAELVENLAHVARAVARLSNNCSDPVLKSFKTAFDDLIRVGADPFGWQFTWKKMGRKVKKMERYIAANATLYQEMESIAELEQTLRRMKGNGDIDGLDLVEYKKKVAWKQQEVKHLKRISLWNRTYDYVVCLLVRSIFTVVSRIGHAFGINYVADMGNSDSRFLESDYIHHSRSVSLLAQSSVHPSDSTITRFSSGPLGREITHSGSILMTTKPSCFYSGPLGNPRTTSSSVSSSGRRDAINFFSGPLGKSTTKSGPLSRATKNGLRFWQGRDKLWTMKKKSPHLEPNRETMAGPFKECMIGGNSSPFKNSHVNPNGIHSAALGVTRSADLELRVHHGLLHGYPSILSSSYKPLNPPPETLGAASLALHYANVIVVIERLAASPHLIGHDERDDLYSMLPASIRASLRAKLRPYTKSLSLSVYDAALATEWSEAMSRILEWLAPLAHNMIRWQSERSFEYQSLVPRTNVFLVQTLYFGNQEKTDATITELLVGLNYVWRFSRKFDAKALMECASGRTFDGSLDLDG